MREELTVVALHMTRTGDHVSVVARTCLTRTFVAVRHSLVSNFEGMELSIGRVRRLTGVGEEIQDGDLFTSRALDGVRANAIPVSDRNILRQRSYAYQQGSLTQEPST